MIWPFLVGITLCAVLLIVFKHIEGCWAAPSVLAAIVVGAGAGLITSVLVMANCRGPGFKNHWFREVETTYNLRSVGVKDTKDAPFAMIVHRENARYVYLCDAYEGENFIRLTLPIADTVVSILPGIDKAICKKTEYHSTLWAISQLPDLYEVFLPQGSVILSFREVVQK